MYQPLDCDLHDLLEIACLYRYPLRVELVDGDAFEARALTTRTSAEKEEFFVLEVENDRCEVRLDRLLAITPLEQGARFGRVELAGKVCVA
ncbi:Protein rof [compost metagenome]